ncbi:FYV7 [Acrasis kona]|uniref:FYV7 n=1 Tax=Acrasis kona TaxID=1008807 RepID=A0AAW2YS66_9EUKA
MVKGDQLDKYLGGTDSQYKNKLDKIKKSKDDTFRMKAKYKNYLKKTGETYTNNNTELPSDIKILGEEEQVGKKRKVNTNQPDTNTIKNFTEAKELYKQKQEQIKQDQLARKQQKKQAITKINERVQKKNRMNQKTKKGQPVMRNKIKNLLAQIQKN